MVVVELYREVLTLARETENVLAQCEEADQADEPHDRRAPQQHHRCEDDRNDPPGAKPEDQ